MTPILPARSLPAALRYATVAVLLAGAASACAGGGGSGASPAPSTTTSPPTTMATATTTPPVRPTTTGTAPKRPAAPSTTVAGAGGVHAVDWANTTYPADACDHFAEVVPTEAVVRNGRSGSDMEAGIDAGEGVVYGDLTGDGQDEAVVPLTCRTGGSMKWMWVWLYTGDATAPGGVRRLAKVEVVADDGRFIDARLLDMATIADGHLTTNWRTYAADDLNNAPSLVTALRQHWNGSALVNDGPPAVYPG